MTVEQLDSLTSEQVKDYLAAALYREAALRRLLACVYSGAALYLDDGELLDNSAHPFIDFKRDAPDEIEAAMADRAANVRGSRGVERSDGK